MNNSSDAEFPRDVASRREVCEVITKFHHRHARQPTEGLKEAKKVLKGHLRELQEKLKANGKCDRNEFTGSSYQGVKINNDLEFDILFIIDGKGTVTYDEPPVKPSYMKLKPIPGKGAGEKFESCLDEGFISPRKLGHHFYGALQRSVNALPELKHMAILRRHGPAIQMDFFRDEAIWFSVDMVPTMEVWGPTPDSIRRFVAKPFKGDNPTKDMEMAWRVSHSLEEKSKFYGMDEDNGCRKQCLRVLKALRYRETNMQKLTTYYLKTVLMFLLEEKPELSWKQGDIGDRVLDLLERLQKALETKKLPNFYIREVNLLQDVEHSSLYNTVCRIRNIRQKRQTFLKAFSE